MARSRMTARRLARALLAAPTLVAVLLPGTAAAVTRPNLVITKIKIEEAGPPRYIVINQRGRGVLGVVVTTTNAGRRGAPASHTNVTVTEGDFVVAHRSVAVPALAPGAFHESSVVLGPAPISLGWHTAEAIADAGNSVRESNERDNTRESERFAAVAGTWKVTQLVTEAIIPGLESHRAYTRAGFVFELEHYDTRKSAWVYTGSGTVHDAVWMTPPGCSGKASKDARRLPFPLPRFRFLISEKLDGYDASFPVSSLPTYPLTVHCGTSSYTVPTPFLDLEASLPGKAYVPMAPDATNIHDHRKDTATGTEWFWHFEADV